MVKNQTSTTRMITVSKGLDEYGKYGENNGPIDNWIRRTRVDDPCDEMMPMSNPGDKDYKC